jgi:energy-coupling factor transporter ATP-binding protein EcfA2
MIADLRAIDSGGEREAETAAETRIIKYYRGLASATTRLIDVFLSYNWRDHETVEHVAQQLREGDLHPFLDRWYLAAGQRWVSALEQVMNTCEAVVVFVGPGEMGPWQQRERDFALERQSRSPEFRVIPVLLPGSDPALGLLGQNTWVDLRQGTDDRTSLAILTAAIRGEPPSPAMRDRVHATLSAICPYRGLLYFREEDAPFFFGRETAIDELAAAVNRDPFVAVVGASGCGKSSVVRAGLVHRLRQDRENTWEVIALFPGQEPLSALAKALVPSLEPEMTETDRLAEAQKLASFLAKGEVRLHDVAARVLQKQAGTDRLLLVVDQWEELYTLTREEAAHRRFINEVLDASERGVLRVVVTLRGDFIGKALAYRPLSDRLQGAQQNLGPMTRSELQRAIGGPAMKVGLSLEQGLTEILLNDVADEPGNLPLLEFVLQRLWEDRQRGMLTHAAYHAMGRLHGALAKRAETIFAQLTSLEQETVKKVFLQMVRPGEGAEDTRRRASVAEVGKSAWALVQKLANERLLVTAGRPGEPDSVEVSHEALIYHWERLRSWVKEDREFLLWRERFRVIFGDWLRHNQDDNRLLPVPLLAEAQRWVSGREEALSDQERAFVAESARVENERARKDRQSLERERQSARRLRIAIVALAALVVIGMSALYLFAFTSTTFADATERAYFIAKEVKNNLVDHLQRETVARGLQPASLEESRLAWTEIIRGDPNVTAMLQRTLGDDNLVVGILVMDNNGQVLASSGQHTRLKLAPTHDFEDLRNRSWIENLRELMSRSVDYSTTLPVGISASNQRVVLFRITVLINSVFLKNNVYPTLKALALATGAALFIAVCLASMLRIRYPKNVG